MTDSLDVSGHGRFARRASALLRRRQPDDVDGCGRARPTRSTGRSTIDRMAARIDRLAARRPGELDARDIWVRGDRAKRVAGGFEFGERHGERSRGGLSVRADTAVVANVGNRQRHARRSTRPIATHGEFRVEATSANGPQLLVHGAGALVGRHDARSTRYASRSRFAIIGSRLERPTTHRRCARMASSLDTMRVRDVHARPAHRRRARCPVDGARSRLSIRADSVELGDIGELIQANVPFGGLATDDASTSPAFGAIRGSRSMARSISRGSATCGSIARRSAARTRRSGWSREPICSGASGRCLPSTRRCRSTSRWRPFRQRMLSGLAARQDPIGQRRARDPRDGLAGRGERVRARSPRTSTSAACGRVRRSTAT